MRYLIENWREIAPAGAAVLVLATALAFAFRRRVVDPREIERERRTYLNRVGRIVEGQILEIMDRAVEALEKPPKALFGRRLPAACGVTRLLFYTYSISGVSYETAQDITGLEERALLGRVVAGQAASVKYDPANPSNSILLADDWSGIH